MKCSGDVFLPRRTSVRDDSNVAVSVMQGQDSAQIVAVVSVSRLAISMDGWAVVIIERRGRRKVQQRCARATERGRQAYSRCRHDIYPDVLAPDVSLL